jgi:alanine dehydrogenase
MPAACCERRRSRQQRNAAVRCACQQGWKKALADDVHLKNGLNVAFGKVTANPSPTRSATRTCRLKA